MLGRFNHVLIVCLLCPWCRLSWSRDALFQMDGYRDAWWWNDTLRCPLCGQPSPSKGAHDEVRMLGALIHNVKELTRARKLCFLQGRAQPKGKRATSNAYGKPDYSARANADGGLLGTDAGNRRYSGVYIFSFWCAASLLQSVHFATDQMFQFSSFHAFRSFTGSL